MRPKMGSHKSIVRGICPACESKESQNHLPDTYDAAKIKKDSYGSRKEPEFMHRAYQRCTHCGLLFNREVSTDEIETAYADTEFTGGEEAVYAAKSYATYLRKVLAPRASGRALEIGCGSGPFLRELIQLGYENVRGIEPSKLAVEAASADVSGLIDIGFFDQMDLKGKYDLIACFQTLEHVTDPYATLVKARALLDQGGVLAVVVHDHLSLVNRLLGLSSPIYDIEHLQIFSNKSLHSMLHRSGFQVVSMKSISNTYPLSYWTKLAPLPAGLKRMAARLAHRWNPSISVNVGNIMALATSRL
jgi:2-polyprenyl-3-methyl-5-hydroxy-6-metoxy-1,4-benzoquinol methylase